MMLIYGKVQRKKRIEANQQIQKARQAALKILKPSKKDLEHGLELHANSLVVESYGCSPRAAVDGDKIKAAIEKNLDLEYGANQ